MATIQVPGTLCSKETKPASETGRHHHTRLDHTRVNSAVGNKPEFVGIKGMTIPEDAGKVLSWSSSSLLNNNQTLEVVYDFQSQDTAEDCTAASGKLGREAAGAGAVRRAAPECRARGAVSPL